MQRLSGAMLGIQGQQTWSISIMNLFLRERRVGQLIMARPIGLVLIVRTARGEDQHLRLSIKT